MTGEHEKYLMACGITRQTHAPRMEEVEDIPRFATYRSHQFLVKVCDYGLHNNEGAHMGGRGTNNSIWQRHWGQNGHPFVHLVCANAGDHWKKVYNHPGNGVSRGPQPEV